MLILSRKKHDTVVIGDEIKLTVERISSGDDVHGLPGATVKLGFQSPRSIPIFRGELYRQGSANVGGKRPPRRRRDGRIVDVSDATVHVRIQVPVKIPVMRNGTRLTDGQTDEHADSPDEPRSVVHYVTCRKEDRITICHNITISMLDIHRFIPARQQFPGSQETRVGFSETSSQ